MRKVSLCYTPRTDADVELFFAGKNNPFRFYEISVCGDERFQRTRARVIKLFQIWKQVEPTPAQQQT